MSHTRAPRTVVIGGSGFLGSHLADALTDAGHQVVVFDQKESAYLKPSQEMVLGSIHEPEALRGALAGADHVYHLAGIADLDGASTRPQETVHQNILGTVNVLEACREAKVKRFLYSSTIYVYSEKGGFYRCSKQAAEQYIEEYERRYGLRYTILRFGTIYGPRADDRNSVFRYLRDALRKRRVVCQGTGEELREYVHARDAAHLSVEVLAPDHENKRVTITGHHPTRFRDFLKVVQEIFSFDVEVVFEPSDPGNTAHYSMTPYSYSPKIGYKLTSNTCTDFGQGLLECLEEMTGKD